MTKAKILLTVSQYRAIRHLIGTLNGDPFYKESLDWVTKRVGRAFSKSGVELLGDPDGIPDFEQFLWKP